MKKTILTIMVTVCFIAIIGGLYINNLNQKHEFQIKEMERVIDEHINKIHKKDSIIADLDSEIEELEIMIGEMAASGDQLIKNIENTDEEIWKMINGEECRLAVYRDGKTYTYVIGRDGLAHTYISEISY